jgi:hypothetical protein
MTDSLQQSIWDIFHPVDGSSFAPDNSVCENCDSVVEYRPFTFFYQGQSWEVCLPVCEKCQPSAPLLTYEA